MKNKTSLLFCLILAIGLMLTGCTSPVGFHDERLGESKPIDSIDNHAPPLEHHESTIVGLEEKIMRLQEQIAVFNQEEYFDPHEFRLSSWGILKGSYQNDWSSVAYSREWAQAF